jgi:hypothetical protein
MFLHLVWPDHIRRRINRKTRAVAEFTYLVAELTGYVAGEIRRSINMSDDYMPTRDEAENNEEKFYLLIRKLLEGRSPLIKKPVTLEKLAKEIGTSKATVMRHLDAKDMSDEHRKLISDWVFDEGILTGSWRARAVEFPHFLYFALLEFFKINETSQDNARSHIVGTYELWRYSVEDDNEFVHGKLVFKVDDSTGAVCAHMHQPKQPKDGLRGSHEIFNGYLIRIADMYAMLLKDEANKDLRITIFPRFRIESIGEHLDPNSVLPKNTNHIVHLDGFGLGIDGNNLFFSPVYATLVDNNQRLAKLDKELDVVPGDKVPPRVLKRLQKFPRILK